MGSREGKPSAKTSLACLSYKGRMEVPRQVLGQWREEIKRVILLVKSLAFAKSKKEELKKKTVL